MEKVSFTPAPPSVPALRLPQNNAYQGSVITGALRPRFAWEASTVKKGEITYEVELSADRTFATGVISAVTTEPSYRPAEPLPVATTAPVGRRYYWHVRACVEANCSEYSPTWWVNLGRSDRDFNGDGYADVAIGAPRTDEGTERDVGRVYVYFGGPGRAIDSPPTTIIRGLRADDNFGYYLSSAGDFNGDGFADLVVGTGSPYTERKRADLFLGAPGPVFDATRDLTFADIKRNVTTIGDVNGDGFSDLAANIDSASIDQDVCIYLGGAKGTLDQCVSKLSAERFGEEFGGQIAAIGDVNGDGFSDLAILSRNAQNTIPTTFGPCINYVYLGGEGNAFDKRPDHSIVGEAQSECEYALLANGADLNADGRSDLVMASALRGPADAQVRAYLKLPASGSAPDQVLRYGAATPVATALGDINADGADDVMIIGGPPTPNAAIHLGNSEGATPGVATTPAAVFPLGYVAAGAGDVNGDGVNDLLVSNPNDATSGLQAGRAYLYFGNPGGSFEAGIDVIFDGGIADSFFGKALVLHTPATHQLHGAREKSRPAVVRARPAPMPPSRTRR